MALSHYRWCFGHLSSCYNLSKSTYSELEIAWPLPLGGASALFSFLIPGTICWSSDDVFCTGLFHGYTDPCPWTGQLGSSSCLRCLSTRNSYFSCCLGPCCSYSSFRYTGCFWHFYHIYDAYCGWCAWLLGSSMIPFVSQQLNFDQEHNFQIRYWTGDLTSPSLNSFW